MLLTPQRHESGHWCCIVHSLGPPPDHTSNIAVRIVQHGRQLGANHWAHHRPAPPDLLPSVYRLPVCAEGMNRLAQISDGVLPDGLAKSGQNREIPVFRGAFHTPRLWNRRNTPAGWLSSMTAWTSRPLAGMGRSIPSCRGEIKRVFQPPPELRQGEFPATGWDEGCFQPGPARAGPGWPSGLGDHAADPVLQQGHGGEVHWLGSRLRENEVKRSAGGPGRETPAELPA